MAESQKETSSAIDSKKKSSVLDEEIEGEFLSPWKSKTVDKDPFDFDCETVPKGRKSTFNFGKMDMDFELGGDFDKITSFKMHVSDLDFSSSPRKADEKPKDNSRKESLLGKKEGKQDPFTFSFDFNELDSFDLDSSLLKADKKSEKPPVSKAVDSTIQPAKNQHSTSNSSTSMDLSEIGGTKKLQSIDSGITAKLDNLVRGQDDIDASNDGALLLENSGNQDAPPVTTCSLETQTTTFAQQVSGEHNEAWDHKEQSHMTSFLKPNALNAIQATSTQSVSGEKSLHGTVPKLQMGFCSLNAEADANPCSDPAVSAKSVSSSRSQNSSPVKSYNSKASIPTVTIKTQKSGNEFEKDSESQEDVSKENETGKESTQAKTVNEDVTIETISKQQHGSNALGEKSILNVLISPLHRESALNRLAPSKEKETDAISSEYFRKPEDVRSQFSPPPAKKKIYAICDKKIDGLHVRPTDNKSHELRDNEGLATSQMSNTLKSLTRPAMKGLSVIVGSKKNVKDCDISCSQVRPTSLAEHLIPSGTPKIVKHKTLFSSIAPVRNSKTSSDKKMFEIANLKISRNVTSNSEPLKSTGQQETNSVKLMQRSMETDVNMTCKMVYSANSDKLSLLSPSLKRKYFEGANADPSPSSPLKRATESPTESRNALKDPQRTEDERATFTPDCPLETSMTDLEVPLLMESDGNVEKAEACAKELDDMCNMLKKKHDEAKELLVRAIVNNNQLLMLNHPIFEEKIRKIQMYAKSVLYSERQF